MDPKTKGAWLINHAKKLNETTYNPDFEDINTAGKSGILLSVLSADNERSISKDKFKILSKNAGISALEADGIKNTLAHFNLIDIGTKGDIQVLGVTTSSILSHTANIFDQNEPSSIQKAAIDLSENVSDLPGLENNLKEFVSDSYHLEKKQIENLFQNSEIIKFIDYESLEDGSKIYFNGNLFKRESMEKARRIIQSLDPDSIRRIQEFDQKLSDEGCVTESEGLRILGIKLLSKLTVIGIYELNEVSNQQGRHSFLTKPSAFSKFGDPFQVDALDLAKAFVASLTYGIKVSSSGRGKIQKVNLLLSNLIEGNEVGPATAIGQDYQLLEFKGVIQLRPSSTAPGMFFMKLLKKDIGELALHVLKHGDLTEHAIKNLTSKDSFFTNNITGYRGPEQMRLAKRRNQTAAENQDLRNELRTLRIKS